MQLSEREWLIISNMILKMNDTENVDDMRLEVLKSLRRLIPYDMASFYLASQEDGSLLANPVGVGFPDGVLEWYAANHASDAPLSWTNEYPRNLVIRDTDVIPDNELRHQWYYQALKEQWDARFMLTVSMAYNGVNLGVITLFRKSGSGNFSDREIYIAQQVIHHIALRLFWNVRQKSRPSAFSSVGGRSLRDIAFVNGLSNREADVFVLLCKCKRTDEISKQLLISEATLKKHISSIYHKLGIRNRYELLGVVAPEVVSSKE